MKVRFNRDLASCYGQSNTGTRRWGVAVARKYIQRVDTIKAAATIQDLRSIRALRLHELEGERKGQLSIDLHDRWRLIFVFDEETGTAMIVEVTNHYGD